MYKISFRIPPVIILKKSFLISRLFLVLLFEKWKFFQVVKIKFKFALYDVNYNKMLTKVNPQDQKLNLDFTRKSKMKFL